MTGLVLIRIGLSQASYLYLSCFDGVSVQRSLGSAGGSPARPLSKSSRTELHHSTVRTLDTLGPAKS